MLLEDEKFMARALQLANMGRATVSPNPMVGCVIVHNGKIIGEGWHQKAGSPHAEVLAIRSVKNQELLSSSTAYVSLEPCAHFGKTPPCADLLVEKKLKRVVIGCTDPNPLVAGQGIAKLKENNIEVLCGVLEKQCLSLNEAFFNYFEKKSPYIILKWAQSADGFIARANYDAKWISSSLSRQLVHKWRSEVDAILVGKNTVLYDNPYLNTRDWAGQSPVRLIVDHQCQLNGELNIFDRSLPTFVFNVKREQKEENLHWVKLDSENFLQEMLAFIYKQKIQSVLVEGGANTLQQFIDAGLWDEARIFTSYQKFETGIPTALLKNAVLNRHEIVGGDELNYWHHKPSQVEE